MACVNPLLGVNFGKNPVTGKNSVRILPRRVDTSYESARSRYGSMLMMLPCGRCPACILARRKMWALRCYAESLYHKDKCFVTLTYDDEHLPKLKAHYDSDGVEDYLYHPLVKSDFQKFIKSLRNSGIKVRYYGCGEYGGKSSVKLASGAVVPGRPHYHLILFGYFPLDVKYYSKTASGFAQFTSKLLTDLWAKGMVVVSDFTPEVAAYVAGYVDKKYKQNDCFSLMSKKPGLGEQYFLDHYQDFYKTDSLVTNFGTHVAHIPKYFDKLAEKLGIDISDIKNQRIDYIDRAIYEEMRTLWVKHYEQVQVTNSYKFKDKLGFKKRGL